VGLFVTVLARKTHDFAVGRAAHLANAGNNVTAWIDSGARAPARVFHG
jgi:hypothetical protein